MKKLYVFAVAAWAAALCHAQEPALPVQLVTQSLHIGDQTQKDMTHANPDAPAFEAKFVLAAPSRIGEVYLIVTVSHLVPKDYPGFDQGFWQTTVQLNGTPLGVLNKQLRGRDENSKVETLVMPMKAALLRAGDNVLLIKPGAKDGDLDDFELHGASIESQRPR